MEEIWKDISIAKGYQVSNLGRVRSFWKSWLTHRERKQLQKKRRRIKHWEGLRIPPNSPSRAYIQKVLFAKLKKWW